MTSAPVRSRRSSAAGPRRLLRALSLVAVMPCAAGLNADTLVLEDGTRVMGTVVEQGEHYEVQTPVGVKRVRKAEVRSVEKEASIVPSPAALAPVQRPSADPASEGRAAELLGQASQLIERRQHAQARTILERIVKEHKETAAFEEARERLRTLPNAYGRLLTGFDSEAEATPAFSKGAVQATWVWEDRTQVREGPGSVRVQMSGAGVVVFPIPPTNLEKLQALTFWMYSEPKMHQKRTIKLGVFSPRVGKALNFLDSNLNDADPHGWKRVQVTRAQLKGEGGGMAFGFSNGMPSLRQVTGIGFLLPAGNAQDFIVDDVRVLVAGE